MEQQKGRAPAPRMVKKTSLTTALNQETEQGKSRGKPNPAEQKAPWPSKWMFEIPSRGLLTKRSLLQLTHSYDLSVDENYLGTIAG